MITTTNNHFPTQAGLNEDPAAILITAASASLTTQQRKVKVSGHSSAVTITLPNVSKAKGLTFVISGDGSTDNITVQDNDESEGWADLVNAAADGVVTLQSDGERWLVLESVLS